MDEKQRDTAIHALKFILVSLEGDSAQEFSFEYTLADEVFRGAIRYGEGQGFMRMWGPEIEERAANDEEKLKKLLRACEMHAAQSEPFHEIGDLQDILRACWVRMSRVQRDEVFCEFEGLRNVWRET